MGSIIQTGYSLPGGNEPLTHARILHNLNRFKVKTITASSEVTGFEGEAADNGLTYDAWHPHSNSVPAPTDLAEADWTTTRFVVGTDGQTLDEGADASTTRFITSGSITFTAVEWVVGVKVERQTMDGIQVSANDGTSTFTADFDLRDGSVDATGAGTTAKIVDLGDVLYECIIYFTPAAAAGSIAIYGWDATSGTTT